MCVFRTCAFFIELAVFIYIVYMSSDINIGWFSIEKGVKQTIISLEKGATPTIISLEKGVKPSIISLEKGVEYNFF